MRRLQEITKETDSMQTISELTNVFEGIASMRIAQIKNQVLKSQEFFHELWHIYTQLRVDTAFRLGITDDKKKISDKELFIVVTAEGSFSGDIDERLIKYMLENYDPKKQDIIVIGHHGAVQLTQAGISFKKYFKLPASDQNINVGPLIQEVQLYKTSYVYYQTYVSLMVQDVKRINLVTAVQEQGKASGEADEVITERNYIFEPTTEAVVGHLERSMLNIMLAQVIFESKLAQYASRFKAMSSANKKADETIDQLRWLYGRAKRSQKDERIKEIVNGLRKASVT